MDRLGQDWHYSGMSDKTAIPVFNLFGETSVFPDVIHCERIWDRARHHDWQISPHRHRDIAQIFFMRQGSGIAQVDGQTLRMKDRSILYIPPRIVHGFTFNRGAEGLVLSLPMVVVSGLVEMSEALATPLGSAYLGRADRMATALLDQIAQRFLDNGVFRANILVALAQALLGAIAENRQSESAASAPQVMRRLEQLDRLLARKPSNGWGVSEFAGAMSVTPGHLSRICKAATGRSASHYIETARMTEAGRLLAFTQLSVAEIGYRLGYEDPSYFSRRFRVATGQTPSAYRARFEGQTNAAATSPER